LTDYVTGEAMIKELYTMIAVEEKKKLELRSLRELLLCAVASARRRAGA
jgi:hypothetical protein